MRDGRVNFNLKLKLQPFKGQGLSSPSDQQCPTLSSEASCGAIRFTTNSIQSSDQAFCLKNTARYVDGPNNSRTSARVGLRPGRLRQEDEPIALTSAACATPHLKAMNLPAKSSAGFFEFLSSACNLFALSPAGEITSSPLTGSQVTFIRCILVS